MPDLIVRVIGNTSDFDRAMRRASGQTEGFGRGLARVGKTAAIAAGAAGIGALVIGLKRGIDEFTESTEVAAQTAAGIKSTGGAAHVTAQQVSDLATRLSKMSGVDDEVIQHGENLLLTFKRVRNEAGEGGKVFDRATRAALDLSVRGFGSVDTSAKQLGKALSDPVKGIGALKRAGVDFTDAQKKTIAALVETGDLLGAQKIILKEVEGQVGGSAKAYGETLPGQLSKLRNAFDELAGNLVAKVAPALTKALNWLLDYDWGKVIDGIKRFYSTSGLLTSYVRVWKDLARVMRDVFRGDWDKAKKDFERFAKDWLEYARQAALAIIPALKTLNLAVLDAYKAFGQDILRALGFGNLANTLGRFIDALKQYVRGFAEVFKGIFTGDFSLILKGLEDIFAGLAKAIAYQLQYLLQLVWDVIDKAAAAFAHGMEALAIAGWNAFVGALGDLAGYVGGQLTAAVNAVTQAIISAYNAALAFGARILTGVKDGLVGLVTWVGGKVMDAINAYVGLYVTAYNKAVEFGSKILTGIKDGVEGIATWVAGRAQAAIDTLGGFFVAAYNKAREFGAKILEGVQAGVLGIATFVSEKLQGAIDAVSGFFVSAYNTAKTFGSKIKDGIVDGVQGIVGAVRGIINSVINAINRVVGGLNALHFNVHIPGVKVLGHTVIPEVNLDIDPIPVDIPSIPALATGGIIARPTLAMLGERGPEAVVPLSRMSAGPELHVHIEGPIFGGREAVARELAGAIHKEFARMSKTSGPLFSRIPGVVL